MSIEKSFLALRLQGPIQSWGVSSRFNRRNTGLTPSKSAIAGICCAALGHDRGSQAEKEFLSGFSTIKMTTIIVPRVVDRNRKLPVRRLIDYHTVKNTKTADGKPKPSHITYRQYLTDASFGVLLEGNGVILESLANALSDPIWGIWLGRKTCAPTAPIFAGLCVSKADALKLLIGDDSLDRYTWQKDVDEFSEGRDTLMDSAISFDSDNRLFFPRRIKTVHKIE